MGSIVSEFVEGIRRVNNLFFIFKGIVDASLRSEH